MSVTTANDNGGKVSLYSASIFTTSAFIKIRITISQEGYILSELSSAHLFVSYKDETMKNNIESIKSFFMLSLFSK